MDTKKDGKIFLKSLLQKLLSLALLKTHHNARYHSRQLDTK